MRRCVFLCVRPCVCTCVFVFMCMCVRDFVFERVCVLAGVCVGARVRLCESVCGCVHAQTYEISHIHIPTHP